MLNKIVIMGRLTRDVELRYTQSEKPVASFALAVQRDGRDAKTDFIECVAWNNTALFADKYFSKGSMAIVSGRLTIREWTDNAGNKRRTAEVVAESIYFGESKKASSEASTTSQGYATHEQGFTELPDDGELPF